MTVGFSLDRVSTVSLSRRQIPGVQCFSFRKEARVVRVCALAVTPSDRRRGVARSDVFSNATLRPPSVRCFLFTSSLPKPAHVSFADSLVGSAAARPLACFLSFLIPGTTTSFLSIFLFLVSRFRHRTVTDPFFPPPPFGSRPPSFGSRHSVFPFLSLPASLLLPSRRPFPYRSAQLIFQLINIPLTMTDVRSAVSLAGVTSTILLAYSWVVCA